MRENILRHNDIGLFFCWGVKHGIAEKNTLVDNAVGVSIGHRDTDNVIRDNEIRQSGKVGVLFRPERGRAFAPHRNRLESNHIFDTGSENGIGIDVQGETESITIARNMLRETRKPLNRIGIKIGPQTKAVTLVDNSIEGFAVALSDLRKT